MMKSRGIGQKLLHALFITACLSYVLPFMLIISISISSERAIAEFGYTLLPKVIDFEAYRHIFSNPSQLIDAYTVTIFFSAITTALSVFIMTLMAYPLSRPNFKLRGVVTFYMFFTLLFNGGIVPSYIINTKYLRLDNNVWIYILPSLVNAWHIIIIRTFFQGLPEGLVESAKIDGASELRTYFQIVMPLSKPVIATMAFLVVITKWNDWQTSLMYIRSPKLYSLQYMLQKILREAEFLEKVAKTSVGAVMSDAQTPTESMRYAMALLASGPVLIIFPFFQKHFTKGLTIGAVKG